MDRLPRTGNRATGIASDTMRITSIFTLPLLASAALTAQTCAYSFVSDPLGSSRMLESPFGRVSGVEDSRIVQFKVSRVRFQNAPIRITGLAFSMTQDTTLSFARLRIRLGHTAQNSLSLSFAANWATPPQIVMEANDYHWPCRHGEWTEIGLQTPFVYTPAIGDLLVEVVAEQSAGSPVTSRSYWNAAPAMAAVEAFYRQGFMATTGSGWFEIPMVRLCADHANLSWTGESCPGSLGTRPALGFSGSAVLGSTTNIVLSNALPAQFALLAFGWDASAPLPLSLSIYGMPGCRLYLSPTDTVGLVSDATGVASHSLAIPPAPSLAGVILFAQYFVADPGANAAQIVSTNVGRIQPGL